MLFYLIIMTSLTDEEKRTLRAPRMKKKMREFFKLLLCAYILCSILLISILIIIFESW